MSRLLETFSLLFTLTLAYIWVSLPALRGLSLQLTAVCFLAYFLSKRLSHSGWHHVVPRPESIETALLLGAIALLVGSTGGLASPFVPLFYLLLFLSALTLNLGANIVEMVALTVFLWGTSAHPLSTAQTIELFSLPLLLPLMVFARYQFEEAQEQQHLVEQEEALLSQEESEVIIFLSTYLRPKLQHVRVALETSKDNVWLARKQLELLEKEAQDLLQSVELSASLHEGNHQDDDHNQES